MIPIIIVAIVFGGIALITLGSIWMGISYQSKKKGLTKGASKRELQEIRNDMSQIKVDLNELKKQVAELIIMIDDMK